MIFISVDLPEPDGPMIATISPWQILSGHAVQRVHFHIPHPVDLGDVLELDDRSGVMLSLDRISPLCAA